MQTRKKNISHSFIGLLVALLLPGCSNSKSVSDKDAVWVGTWSTAPQRVEPHNMPPGPGLSNNTLRQVVRVSIGGDVVRLRFSNVFSQSPVELKTVAIARSVEDGTIDVSSQKTLKFNNEQSVVMVAGSEVFSDPVNFDLKPGSRLAVTIYFGETSSDLTGHPGSRTTSYILSGDNISSPDFAQAVKTDHWYVINAVDVLASPTSAAIAVLGNSITDGRGSGTNKQNRWTDILSERLLATPETKHIGVLNMGIGGNCVLRGGLGPTALERFDRDILSQSNVGWLIVSEGINDIGGIQKPEDAGKVARELMNAYDNMVAKAHLHGIYVYGATILPFANSFYDTEYRQLARDTVNEWIRNSGRFDAVIDFDEVMRNPDEVKTILPDMHDNDFLHPNEAGYKKMGESVELSLFDQFHRTLVLKK